STRSDRRRDPRADCAGGCVPAPGPQDPVPPALGRPEPRGRRLGAAHRERVHADARAYEARGARPRVPGAESDLRLLPGQGRRERPPRLRPERPVEGARTVHVPAPAGLGSALPLRLLLGVRGRRPAAPDRHRRREGGRARRGAKPARRLHRGLLLARVRDAVRRGARGVRARPDPPRAGHPLEPGQAVLVGLPGLPRSRGAREAVPAAAGREDRRLAHERLPAHAGTVDRRDGRPPPAGEVLLDARTGRVGDRGRLMENEQEQQEHYRVRLGKLEELERRGVDAFPVHASRTHTAAEALAAFGTGLEVAVDGRIVTQIKRFGKLIFCHLQDVTGRIQLAFKYDVLGADCFQMLELIDSGDILEARGPLFKTKTGEITVEVRAYRLLAKALRPLPEKWHGLTDTEKRYRQRYLDLITNEDARRTFIVRSKVVSAIRRFLDARGFLEVETPVLQPIYGGAYARPFVTHHNALDRQLYLRIAFELYLKRLIVGGLDKVYEIGRDFRNEGIDRLHNPEFTMLETYEAYADYRDVMAMVEE